MKKTLEELKAKRDKLDRKIKKIENLKFEVGWYWGSAISKKRKGWLAYYSEKNSNPDYGFNNVGHWGTPTGYFDEKCIKATNEEVEQALVEEAKRRGFKEGVFITTPFKDRGEGNEMKDNLFDYERHTNMLWVNSTAGYNRAIFKDGVWAEITEEKIIIINGHEMQVDGDIVSFGCARFHKSDLKRWYQAATKDRTITNRHIISYKLDSGVEISIEDLEKIVKAL